MPALLQSFLRLVALKRLGVLLFVLAATLCATSNASALEPVQTKTRVWGFDFAEHNSAGLFRAPTGGKHQGNRVALSELASGSLLAAEEIATIDTAAVRFTQSSVKSTFSDGRTLQSTIDALKGPGGDALAREIPAIRIFEEGGVLKTLDNRRLLTFSEAGRAVPYTWASPAEIAAESWKFTATPQQMGGWFIRVK